MWGGSATRCLCGMTGSFTSPARYITRRFSYPENIGAIRALTGFENTEASIEATNCSLGITTAFLPATTRPVPHVGRGRACWAGGGEGGPRRVDSVDFNLRAVKRRTPLADGTVPHQGAGSRRNRSKLTLGTSEPGRKRRPLLTKRPRFLTAFNALADAGHLRPTFSTTLSAATSYPPFPRSTETATRTCR